MGQDHTSSCIQTSIGKRRCQYWHINWYSLIQLFFLTNATDNTLILIRYIMQTVTYQVNLCCSPCVIICQILFMMNLLTRIFFSTLQMLSLPLLMSPSLLSYKPLVQVHQFPEKVLGCRVWVGTCNFNLGRWLASYWLRVEFGIIFPSRNIFHT